MFTSVCPSVLSVCQAVCWIFLYEGNKIENGTLVYSTKLYPLIPVPLMFDFLFAEKT